MRKLDNVVLLMARARILRRALQREERLLLRRTEGRTITLAEGWPWVTYFNLYLANVHVLIERWDHEMFYDEDVAQAATPSVRRCLKRIRNAVFHAGPFNDRDITDAWEKYPDRRQDADAILESVSRFVKR